mmetsp:Transcript_18699/g.58469  ORF Transcript_18699/g.58469 Transcript_18699/m.58469 type:complete len:118 (+) Transcript_18699:634-987(+)
MQPNLFQGGGLATFYGQNLNHNIGFWPRSKTCKTFPTNDDGVTVRDCIGDNGFCCAEYDDDKDSSRTTALILLKVPYSIGFIAALFLHLLLPEDTEDAQKEFEEETEAMIEARSPEA